MGILNFRLTKHSLSTALLRSLALVPLLAGATGCGQLKDMSDLTHQMAGTTTDMLQETELLERQSRQALAAKTRQDAIAIVQQSDVVVESKMINSAIYFSAFEFQLWENILADDEATRQVLLERGAQEFMVTLRGIINGNFDTPDPTQKTGSMPSLLALAQTVDEMNDLQIAASQRTKSSFAAVSMLDLIVTALNAKQDIDQNPNAVYPGYVRQILYFEAEARYLLNLRYNILAAMVIDKISGQATLGLGDTISLDLAALGWSSSWKADFSKINTVEIQQSLAYLKLSQGTRSYMTSVGSTPELNSNIQNLLTKMKISNDPTAGTAKAAATTDFQNGLNTFVKGL